MNKLLLSIGLFSTLVFCLTTEQLKTNDVNALNYALTLANMEVDFYNEYLDLYNETDFANAGFNSSVHSYFILIKNHEMSHQTVIRQAILALGGTPVTACNYTFNVSSVQEFVNLSRTFENTDVAAYNGAINTINDLTLRITAASIATVEARHAAYLNELLGDNPFPQDMDNATSPAVILSSISDYVESCGNNTVIIPQPAVVDCRSNLTTFNKTFTISYNGRSSANATGLDEEELATNDINALNYALTLENLESAFYTTFLSMFNETDFETANYSSSVYTYFTLIKSHELAHVSYLNDTITSLGGTPVPPCNYTFNISSVEDGISIARTLENTGVNAYDGAIATLNNLSLRTAAASIATVEARHAAYLNELMGDSPFPEDLDNATQPAGIRDQISGFIENCPYELVLPKPALNACLNETETSGTTTGSTGTESTTGTSTTGGTTDTNNIGNSAAGTIVPSAILLLATVVCKLML